MLRNTAPLSALALGTLAGCGAPPHSASPDLGAQLYAANCAPCHQQDGRGVPGVYPSLAGSAVVQGDPAALARWVVEGVRPVSMPAGRYATAMPKFGWMKPAAAAALLSFLRMQYGNSAPTVSESVAARALADAPP